MKLTSCQVRWSGRWVEFQRSHNERKLRGKHRHLINRQNPISKEFNITVIRASIVCCLIYVHIKVTRLMRAPNEFPGKVNLPVDLLIMTHGTDLRSVADCKLASTRSMPQETMVSDLIKLMQRGEGNTEGLVM